MLVLGVPHRRPTFLQIRTTKWGRVLEDTVWGARPLAASAPIRLCAQERGRLFPGSEDSASSPSAPRSWLGREAPSLGVPSLLHTPRPRGCARTQAGLRGPLPRRPTPLAEGPWEGAVLGPTLSAYRSGHQDHKQPPGNPADAGSWGQETQQPSGPQTPSRPTVVAVPASPPAKPPQAFPACRAASGRKGAWPPTASSSGLRPSAGRAAVSPQPAGGRRKRGWEGSGGAREARGPLPPNTCLVGGARQTCPRLQGWAGPKQCPARGPHPAPPTPASPRGLRDPQVPRGDAGTALAHWVLYVAEGGEEAQPLLK